MQQLHGYIERITFHNTENGYTVAQLQPTKQTSLVCIVGYLPAIQPGETIRCEGEWKNHLVHGKQFEVCRYQVEAPADLIGIKKYLGSGLIKGIGKKYAEKIVDRFGTETLNIIEDHPSKLLEITGLGSKRLEKICACWVEQKSIRQVMIFLQGHGVSPSYAQKIFKRYGSESVKKVKESPYSLAKDIFGIGFKTADTIAEKLGIGKESAARIAAGIEFLLLQLSSDGHVCYPVDDFLKEAEQVLEVNCQLVEAQLLPLAAEQRIEIVNLIFCGQFRRFVWIYSLYLAENGIARELKRLKKASSLLRAIDTDKAIEWVEQQLSLQLAISQKEAVALALKSKIQIITGGPGTGKSTITNAILKITEKLTQKIILVAPTGRAAKRMSEITGKKASTIHSLLEFDFKAGGFKKNRQNPIDCDLLIIDEASMIDTYLMYSLLKALPDPICVIFVGDINQLPSVGPGNVLKDMISSRTLPVTILTEIFRQAAGSAIITNAHLVNQGQFPRLYNGHDSDFFFIESAEAEQVLNEVIKLVSQSLPKRYGFDPKKEIQVLAPMKKGVIGTANLNVALQQLLNPQAMALHRGGQKFQVGDKVMQLRNDYKREVFNGDIGYIHSIDAEEQQLVICMEERQIIYDYSDLDELTLAYAISIHKFQGSECPCVVMPVHTSHFMLLHRNLLYTGITRGKQLVVLVGTKKALAIAVKKDDVKKRYTGLQQTLMEMI